MLVVGYNIHYIRTNNFNVNYFTITAPRNIASLIRLLLLYLDTILNYFIATYTIGGDASGNIASLFRPVLLYLDPF